MDLKRTWRMTDVGKIAALCVVYFGSAKWGLMLAIVQANATAIWPPTGIALAALLLGGLRLWPGVFLGAFWANLSTAGTVWTSLAIASGNTLEALAGASLVLYFARDGKILERTTDLFKFMLLAVLGSTTLSATIGVGTLFLADMADGVRFHNVWLTWWLGDIGGALLFAPPLLLWPGRPNSKVTVPRVLEGMVVIGLLSLTAWALFGGRTSLSTDNANAEFLFLPTLLWIAVRFGPFPASLSVLALSLAALHGTLERLGPFHEASLNQSLLLLQIFMSITSLTILALALDVSERRKAEEKLRGSQTDLQLRVLQRTQDLTQANSELEREIREKGILDQERRRLALMVDNSSDFICLTDMEGRLTYLNGAGRRMVGLEMDSDIGTRIHKDFIAPVDHPRLENEILPAIVAQGHWEGEFPLRHFRTGESLAFHFNAFLVRDPWTSEPQGMAAIARDIRELKRMDEELNRMAIFVGSVQDYAIIFLDPLGRIESWNSGAEHIKGYKTGEILGRGFSIFYTPEDVQGRKPDQLMERAVHEGRAEEEGWQVRADGSKFWGESILTALRDKKGELRGFAKITRDATQRKRMEELARSNQELEQFAYVASHDLQEPLRMVASYVQLLARKYEGKLDEDATTYIQQAVDGAKRMQALINDLLTYSRIGNQSRAFDRVDFEGVLADVLRNLEPLIRETGAGITHDRLPTVVGDPQQFLQLLQNLVGNALKFHGKEPLRIHIGALVNGNEWIFSIRDNGIGLDPQYAEKVFEIFKRLHSRSQYPGTGMGLAICRKVVSRYGGRIWLESAEGKGTTVHWTLPFSKEAALGIKTN